MDLSIHSLWEELNEEPFNTQSFAEGVLHDCGYDAKSVRLSQVVNLLRDGECEDFRDVLWAFGEVVHYYAVEQINDPKEFVRAVFVAQTLAQGIEAGIAEWDSHLEPVCKFLSQHTVACDTNTRLRLIRQLFCRSA